MVRGFVFLWLAAVGWAHAPILPPLVGPLGPQVLLRGVNVTVGEAATFGTVRVRWNMNCVRLEVRELNGLAEAMAAARAADLAVVIAAPQGDAVFWAELARRFVSEALVVFEVENAGLLTVVRGAGVKGVVAVRSEVVLADPNVLYISAGNVRRPAYVPSWSFANDEQLYVGLIGFEEQGVSWTAPGPLAKPVILWTTGDPDGFGFLRPEAVANSAGGPASALAPGMLATLFVEQLGPVEGAAAARLPLPAELGGTRVLINGAAAPLLYAGAYQVNILVPPDLALGTARVQVIYRGVDSNVAVLPVAEAAPELFRDYATGYVLALNQDGTKNGPAVPAEPGSVVVLFGTGGGKALNQVTVEGAATEVLYAGEAPGFVGLVQINARLLTAPTRNRAPLAVPVEWRVGEVGSRSPVSIWVR